MAYSLLGINKNLAALDLHRNIVHNSRNLFKSMEKLSSGLAINRAADDPAGLVISEQMRSQIASLNQGIENVTNQMNKYATADSAILQARSQLTEMRSLAVAASNEGFVDETMLAAYQSEADNLVGSYNRIRNDSSFGKQQLLDGSEGSVADLPEMQNLDLSSADTAEASLAKVDQQIEQIDRSLVDVGTYQKHDLESSLRSLQIEKQNLTAAESTVRDLDYAMEYSNFLKNSMLFNSGMSLMAHTGSTSQSILQLISAFQ